MDEATDGLDSNSIEQQGKKSNTALIVVLILAVVLILPMVLGFFVCGGAFLSFLAVPRFNDVSESARMSACRANMRTLASQEVIYFAQNGYYTESQRDLGMEGVVCPEGSKTYRITVRGDDLTIECQNAGHGRIENGEASWSQ